MFPSCFLTDQEIFNILFLNILVFLRKHALFLFAHNNRIISENRNDQGRYYLQA